MCGICGIFGPDSTRKTDTMLNALLHRGPDGHQIVGFPWGSLGFCRLDIFGSTGLNQPACSPDRRTSVVFNGEIYNFGDLAREEGAPDGIRDEAELILHLFALHGREAFKRLKGMFAAAVLTPEKLFLARDPLGIKPLAFCLEGADVLFASEIKALLQVRRTSPEIDRQALAETAVFGFIQNLGGTMFRGIEQVLPGTCLEFENGRMTVHRFFTLPRAFPIQTGDAPQNLAGNLSDLMGAAANSYLAHSKHPQAIYLSGGLDSTLMTWFLQKHSHESLSTFTLFDEPDLPDREFAGAVARELGTRHTEHSTNLEECLEVFRHYLFHYESLVTDGIFNVLGSLAFHILTGIISRSFRVAYCGEGADELFGGYYWAHTHPLGMGDRLRARAARVCSGNTHVTEFIHRKFPDDDSLEEEMRLNIFDLLMGPGLTNCHLWSVDRSSSAYSMEARPLFLNDDTRDWALGLPVEQKVSKVPETKLVLRSVAGSLGNVTIRAVAGRKKLGMPAALSKTLKTLTDHAENQFRRAERKKTRPHQEFEGFFFTDLERYLFDEFHSLFITNRGVQPADFEGMLARRENLGQESGSRDIEPSSK